MSVMASSQIDLRTFGKRALPFRAKRTIRSIAFKMLDLGWQLPTDISIRIQSQSDWAIYNEIFAAGDYDPAILLAFEAAQHSSELSILDLGANVGFFALRCVDLVRREHAPVRIRITAVEGTPRVCRQMQARLASQNEMPPYTVVNGLVGERSGSAAISDVEFSGQNHIVPCNSQDQFLVDYVDVEQVVDVGRVGLMKCDIEGSEQSFLKNYPQLLQRTDIVVLELHPLMCDENKCLSLLTAAGLVKQVILAETSGLTKIVMASR
jgi:FkbM family methyltransferase